MANTTLTVLNNQINKLYDVVKNLDNDYSIRLYTPEIEVIRGKYGFNILPQNIITREFSGENSLQNLTIFLYMHYDLEADDKFQPAWILFMPRAELILNAIYDKTNFISGISTVSVDTAFDNPLIERERRIDVTLQCEYKMFATR